MSNLRRVVRAAFAERAHRYTGGWTVFVMRRRGALRWADSRGVVRTEYLTDGAVELEARSKSEAERRGLAVTW